MESAPDISVVMPVYNAAGFLYDAIESVLKQSFKNFELLLIDDGSTDHSKDIIHQFEDERIILIKNEINQGLIFSLNKAIGLARGKKQHDKRAATKEREWEVQKGRIARGDLNAE